LVCWVLNTAILFPTFLFCCKIITQWTACRIQIFSVINFAECVKINFSHFSVVIFSSSWEDMQTSKCNSTTYQSHGVMQFLHKLNAESNFFYSCRTNPIVYSFSTSVIHPDVEMFT
jgi:hypothetical protein